MGFYFVTCYVISWQYTLWNILKNVAVNLLWFKDTHV